MYTTTYSKITQIHSNITETHFVCTGTHRTDTRIQVHVLLHTHTQTNTLTHGYTHTCTRTRTGTQCAGKKGSRTRQNPRKPPQEERSTAPSPLGPQTEVDTIHFLHTNLNTQWSGADPRHPEKAAGKPHPARPQLYPTHIRVGRLNNPT